MAATLTSTIASPTPTPPPRALPSITSTHLPCVLLKVHTREGPLTRCELPQQYAEGVDLWLGLEG